MNPKLERAILLFQQNRFEPAEKELRQVLAEDPHEPYPRALLAICLSERRRFKEATDEAELAIGQGPDQPFAHYALAHVLFDRNRKPEALDAVLEARRLDPHDADFCALEAQCHHDLKKWKEMLAAADRGLEIDAEHVGCANLRSIALVKLGRKSEAGQTIDATLAKEPDSALTHANKGWTLLNQGNPTKALEHFREALRLDPTNAWAQAGIVEALKAKNVIYALMLKYFLFMSRLSGQAQWGIIIGVYFLGRILANVAGANPELAQWLLPIRILLAAFVVMTWVAYPLFNLLLRLNRFGRMVLSSEQITESNWIGAFIAVALVSLVGCIVQGIESPWFIMLVVFGLFSMPLSGVFRCNGVNKKIMIAATGILMLVGLGAVAQSWRAVLGAPTALEGVPGLLGFFAIGILGTTLLANFLSDRQEMH